ncbi:MAG: PRC-barrel domain-containing protein [Methylocystaceae bacterium]|nr:MAG: PRC-barrel domain-containing protein [Methylocystaceae bacterium]KAF0211587.1 MAG: PRC-barrel domain-containing [Methylocystaceae bacterium]TXT47371.1 MAG: PRC-barrel domain-containing protein [Methylocystaceae bacterium]
MKSLNLLIATVAAIALSASVTANAARDRTGASSSKNQTQSRSTQQEKPGQAAKDAEDTTSRSGWREMGRDDDVSPTWRGSAARERMRDQDSQPGMDRTMDRTGMDRQTTRGRSAAEMRELDQLGSARVIFYRLGPTDMRMSQLIGSDVRNLQNDDIGEIEDVIFDNNRNLRAVIVSVGGFLGIGERHIAIDPSSMVVSRNEDGDVEAVVNSTRDDLRNAPEFRFDERRRRVGSYQ